MKLLDSFPEVSKTEWLNKIKKDNKRIPMDDFNFELWPDHIISPFFHGEDVDRDLAVPVSSKALLGYHLKIRNEIQDNKLILDELNGGVNYLSLDLSGKKSVNFQLLLEGVFIDLINFKIRVGENPQIASDLNIYLSEFYKSSPRDNIIVIEEGIETLTFNKGIVLNINANIDPVNELLEVIANAREIFEKGQHYNQYIATISFNHNYYLNIIKTRALQLMWANLCEAYDKMKERKKLFINGIINSNAISSHLYDNMIAFPHITLSMVSSGVNAVFIPPVNNSELPEEGVDSLRISRNIFNLLALESHVTEVIDPAAGSYFFESQTQTLAENVWNQLINKEV